MKRICAVPDLRKVGLRLAISVNWKLEERQGLAPTKFRYWSKLYN